MLPLFIDEWFAESDEYMDFPIQLSPLQGSLTIKRPQTFIKHEYANGDEQRERRGLSRGFILVSFNVLLNEGVGEKTLLDDFYDEVESHIQFNADVPGVGMRLWFFNTPPEISHVGHEHWNASLSLKSQR
jgi:hypothetical protein